MTRGARSIVTSVILSAFALGGCDALLGLGDPPVDGDPSSAASSGSSMLQTASSASATSSGDGGGPTVTVSVGGGGGAGGDGGASSVSTTDASTGVGGAGGAPNEGPCGFCEPPSCQLSGCIDGVCNVQKWRIEGTAAPGGARDLPRNFGRSVAFNRHGIAFTRLTGEPPAHMVTYVKFLQGDDALVGDLPLSGNSGTVAMVSSAESGPVRIAPVSAEADSIMFTLEWEFLALGTNDISAPLGAIGHFGSTRLVGADRAGGAIHLSPSAAPEAFCGPFTIPANDAPPVAMGLGSYAGGEKLGVLKANGENIWLSDKPTSCPPPRVLPDVEPLEIDPMSEARALVIAAGSVYVQGDFANGGPSVLRDYGPGATSDPVETFPSHGLAVLEGAAVVTGDPDGGILLMDQQLESLPVLPPTGLGFLLNAAFYRPPPPAGLLDARLVTVGYLGGPNDTEVELVVACMAAPQ